MCGLPPLFAVPARRDVLQDRAIRKHRRLPGRGLRMQALWDWGEANALISQARRHRSPAEFRSRVNSGGKPPHSTDASPPTGWPPNGLHLAEDLGGGPRRRGPADGEGGFAVGDGGGEAGAAVVVYEAEAAADELHVLQILSRPPAERMR